MLPNPDTYCELDPDVVDQWGIPALRFHFKFSDYELLQAKDMQETFRAIVATMGGEYRTKPSIHGQYPFGIEAGGTTFYATGPARRAASPKPCGIQGFWPVDVVM